jgi:hypothetical protein
MGGRNQSILQQEDVYIFKRDLALSGLFPFSFQHHTFTKQQAIFPFLSFPFLSFSFFDFPHFVYFPFTTTPFQVYLSLTPDQISKKMKTAAAILSAVSLAGVAFGTPLAKRDPSSEVTANISGWATDVDSVNNFLNTATTLSATDVANLATAVLAQNVMDEPNRLSFLCQSFLTNSFTQAGLDACNALPSNFGIVPQDFQAIINNANDPAEVSFLVDQINSVRLVVRTSLFSPTYTKIDALRSFR